MKKILWAVLTVTFIGLYLFTLGATAETLGMEVIEETTKEGIDAFWLAVAAAVGTFVKSPQHFFREWQSRRNGNGKNFHDGKDIGTVAYESISAHEIACEERYREVFALIRAGNERFNEFALQNAKDMGELKVIVARIEERTSNT